MFRALITKVFAPRYFLGVPSWPWWLAISKTAPPLLAAPDGQAPSLLGLLRDIQQHPDAHQRHKQRRSPIGNKGQRNALRRHQPENYADVDERLEHDHAGNPHGQKTPEVILCAQSRARSPPQKNCKKNDDRQRSDQSQFLRRHRENKIRMRLRKIKEFLLSFHQSESSYSSSSHRNQRLNNVEAKSLWIGVWI